MLDMFAAVGVTAVVLGALWMMGQWMNTLTERKRAGVNEWIGRVGLVMMFAGVASVILPAIF